MRLFLAFSMICALALAAQSATVCNPRDLQGAYGLQLTGNTTVSGDAKPTVTLSRLAFDDQGNVSGTSSVKFAGYLLGNPVTGTYEAHDDCSVTWALQDDSGGFQHFSGTAKPGGRLVDFRQTDPGGPQRGLMVRTGDDCKQSDLAGKYAFALSGTIIPMTDGGTSAAVDAKGVLQENNAHHLQLTVDGKPPYTTDVDATVESDCTVEMELSFPLNGSESPTPMQLRGILVDSGKGILAIQADPGAMVAARFTVQ